LARKFHPDKNRAPGATEAFKKIGSAFATLTNSEKRRRYDLYGSVDEPAPSVTRQRHGDVFYQFDGHPGFDADVFNIFFNGGFPFVYRNHRAQTHQPRESERESTYLAYVQILPLLILFGLSFFSNLFVKDAPFSLTRTTKYPVERVTNQHHVNYYVKPTFSEDFDGNLAHMESQVEEQYVYYLRDRCYKEQNQSTCLTEVVGIMLTKFLKLPKAWATAEIATIRFASTAALPERLFRSFFYVPGDQEHRISKMLKISSSPATLPESIPDILVLDCEDAVSFANKDKARSTIASAFASGSIKKSLRPHQSVSLRINPPTTGLAGADLDQVLSKCIQTTDATGSDQWLGPDLITLPKTESIDELLWVEARIQKLFKEASKPVANISLIGMIESPKSLLNMTDLCKEAKQLKIPLVAMVFGSDDYCASLGKCPTPIVTVSVLHIYLSIVFFTDAGIVQTFLACVTHSVGREETNFPRRYMVTVCKAYGLAAVDMVDTDLANMDSFRKNCEFGSQIGYSGKQLIHPKQLEDANIAFSPNPKLVAWAIALVEAAAEASASRALAAGAFTFEGHMIDRPTIRQAQRLVRMAKLVHSS
uniref:J domain-containing protein n=1 Tax=Schistocephalus solidus TaxID=70667 RepID=A0A183S770_SCHSO